MAINRKRKGVMNRPAVTETTNPQREKKKTVERIDVNL